MVTMQIPQWVARFNEYVTTPLSGSEPLNVFNTDEGVAILLTYGPDRDWLKNVTAAGSAHMRRYGKTITVSEPRIVPKAEAARHVTGFFRPIFPRLPFDQAVLLRSA
jgi:deazaflavin-dependent oxidoreductase (nitroreductase family)